MRQVRLPQPARAPTAAAKQAEEPDLAAFRGCETMGVVWLIAWDKKASFLVENHRKPIGKASNGWFKRENPNLKWMITRVGGP